MSYHDKQVLEALQGINKSLKRIADVIDSGSKSINNIDFITKQPNKSIISEFEKLKEI